MFKFNLYIPLIYLLLKLGEVPWIGITVAITFSLYGLIRKKIKVSTDIGLLIETLLISPIAICLFIFLIKKGFFVFCTELNLHNNNNKFKYIYITTHI